MKLLILLFAVFGTASAFAQTDELIVQVPRGAREVLIRAAYQEDNCWPNEHTFEVMGPNIAYDFILDRQIRERLCWFGTPIVMNRHYRGELRPDQRREEEIRILLKSEYLEIEVSFE